MADKVGLLITTTPGDWIDYIDAFTDVWVKRDGQWHVVASHGTRYAEGHSVS